MKFRPLHDRVLVRRIEGVEKTAGGIIIPDTAKEKPQEGKVVAVGTGLKSEDGKVTPLDVQTGDRFLERAREALATGEPDDTARLEMLIAEYLWLRGDRVGALAAVEC